MIDSSKFMGACVYHKDQAYIGSDLEGKVYKDEVGTADEGSVNIQTRWETKSFNGENPTTEKTWRKVTIFGQQSRETTQTAQVFVDGAEASAEITIDSNDLKQSSSGGGIGSFAVGDEAIGEGGGSAEEGRLDFVKQIPIRSSGKNLYVVFKSNGTNNDFENEYIDIEVISRGKGVNKLSEKL